MYATSHTRRAIHTDALPFDAAAAPRVGSVSGHAALLSDGIRGPISRATGSPASDWWLPGAARLCVVVGDGSVSVQVRHRHFSPLPRIAVIGPTDRAHRIVADGAGIVSFAVSPLGWAALVRRPASRFRNLVAPLGEVVRAPVAPRLADIVRIAASDHEAPIRDLLWSIATAHRDEALVHQLALLIEDPDIVQIGGLYERLGMSEARLRALALRHFGLPTKLLLRRARFLRSLARVDYTPGRNSYSDIDPGYHDIPHFLRDADYFLGATPRRFRLLSSQH